MRINLVDQDGRVIGKSYIGRLDWKGTGRYYWKDGFTQTGRPVEEQTVGVVRVPVKHYQT